MSGRPARATILILSLALMSVGMGQSMVFAVLPPLARQLGMGEVAVGAVFSISAVFWVFTSPFWGLWSDRIGRVRILTLGLLGYALSLFLFASAIRLGQLGILAASLWPALVFSRLINGALGSATRPAALNYAAVSSSVEYRAGTISRVESGFTIGTILGPALGSGLLLYSLLAPFYLYACLGLVAAVACALLLKPPPIEQQRPAMPRKLSPLDVRLRSQLIVAVCIGMSNAALLQCIGFYLQDVLHTAPTRAVVYSGLLLSLAALGTTLSQLALVPRFGIYPRQLVLYGLMLVTGSMLLLGVGGLLWTAAVAMAFYGLGFGMVRPGNATLLSLSVRPGEQGAAAGMMGMVIPVGHILTPVVAMPLYRWNPASPFLFSFCLLALLVVLILLHPMFRRKPWQLRAVTGR